MHLPCRIRIIFAVALVFVGGWRAWAAAEKPTPDAKFGNWLFKTPDPSLWKRTEAGGTLIFSIPRPPGDFCTLTLFAGDKAEGDFANQFNRAVAADQGAKGTIKIEADSGAKPGKSTEGFDVITRTLRSETAALHTLHMYLGGQSGERFDLAAFQTSSERSWNDYGAQASQFILSLKLANSLPAAEVAKLLGVAVAPPPTLPGFEDMLAPAPKPAAVAPAPVVEPKIPVRPLSASAIVSNNAVIQKNGKPVDGLKLSQHDSDIFSPALAVAASGVIHAAFVEKHRTTYALAVYHRSSSDAGATWTEAKNLSEEMPGIQVGRCYVLVDARQRTYVIWRAGLGVNFGASPNHGGAGQSNLMYRVLENGKWSKIIPVHPPGSTERQDDGSISYFAAVDAAGRAQVVWTAKPGKWHPELTVPNGTSWLSIAGVGNGLVFQATLDGTTAGAQREIFLTPVAGKGYDTHCDGLDAVNGFVDAAGEAHFMAAVTRTHDYSLSGKSVYALIENKKIGPMLELPELSFHSWQDRPTLLIDAKGRRHAIVLYPAGERPNIRDYLIGTEEEPTIIRQAAAIKGTADGFQAYQGPGGRMVVVMQMNDSGERASGETYVSISSGEGWSTPVNVTNNAGRRSFASTQTSVASNIAISKSYYPGPAAAAFDREGRLVLLMINNEYGLFGSSAFGVSLGGGSSSTPTLQFLRF